MESDRRFEKLWNNPRVVGALWLLAFSLFVGVSLAFMLPRLFVDYQNVIPATKSDLCPGEFLEYAVTVEIKHYPGEATISESWCRAGESGPCANSLAKTLTVPLADYRLINGTPSIQVPVSGFFTPGAYEYWHVAVNGRADGYIVPFTIRADCPAIQAVP